MDPSALELATALGRGDPETVSALIAAGADINYRRDHGYGALLDAVHNRDVMRDPTLLDLLRLLVSHGVELDGITTFKESGLRVLSRLGRFDAVRLLLDAGADRTQLEWTPLIEAVALGSLADVECLARAGAPLEERDWWERTPWLMALLGGDLMKAKLLREWGANTDARGRSGQPPLFYAIHGHHPEVLRWLLDIGQLVGQTDDFGSTPLMEAVDYNDPDCLAMLISAGADVDHETPTGTALHYAVTKEIVNRLLDAGADPRHLAQEGHRALCGLGAVHGSLTGVSEVDFRRARTRRFGSDNPEPMREPFWDAMVRAGISGYSATQTFDPGKVVWDSPVWSAMRFGQSITLLPDGRIVQIGGEHEDHYDPDFCIYNDVFVHGMDGSLAILGYPEEVFPPTDFHTATLIDDAIYVIGSLGYPGARHFGTTPVHRLDVRNLRMDRINTRGEAPGWIYGHRAVRSGTNAILVSGGQVATLSDGGGETHAANATGFVLDLRDRTWRRHH
jgi:ankyrin repeat protein